MKLKKNEWWGVINVHTGELVGTQHKETRLFKLKHLAKDYAHDCARVIGYWNVRVVKVRV